MQNGFAGSASLVKIRGRSQASIRAVDSSSASKQIRSTGFLKQHEKTNTQTTQKQKAKSGSGGYLWMIALVAACLVVFVWFQLRY